MLTLLPVHWISDLLGQAYTFCTPDTISKLVQAIDELQEDGTTVTKKNLMQMTGLSSGTMSKEYVKALLREKRVCQFAVRAKTSAQESTETLRLKEYDKIVALSNRQQRQINDDQDKLENLSKRLNKMTEENKQLKQKNVELRGQRQMLLERMDNSGTLFGMK